jgi:hypothetical protein
MAGAPTFVLIYAIGMEKQSTTYTSSAAGARALLLEHLEAHGWKVDDYDVATQGTSAGSINAHLAAYTYYSFDAMGDKDKPRVMVHVTRVDATPERLVEVKKNKDWAAAKLPAAPYVAPVVEEAPAAAASYLEEKPYEREEKDWHTSKPARPVIVCLCGSTRFRAAFEEANLRETLAGRIVLMPGHYTHAEQGAQGFGHKEEFFGLDVARQLEELYLRKIDLADEVLILNVGGYVGASTRAEVAYAKSQGKVVRWLEEELEPALGYAPLHPELAPGVDGQLVSLAYLEGNAGLLEASASGALGGWVAVYLAARQGIDVGGAQFAVVCEHHSNIGAARTIRQATELLRKPALFCPDCCGHLASQPAKLEAGLEHWHRQALISMALLQPDPLAEYELKALTDEELVTAAGFQPMLPALLQSDLPRQ